MGALDPFRSGLGNSLPAICPGDLSLLLISRRGNSVDANHSTHVGECGHSFPFHTADCVAHPALSSGTGDLAPIHPRAHSCMSNFFPESLLVICGALLCVTRTVSHAVHPFSP